MLYLRAVVTRAVAIQVSSGTDIHTGLLLSGISTQTKHIVKYLFTCSNYISALLVVVTKPRRPWEEALRKVF